MTDPSPRFSAVLLAGSRPGTDPLAAAAGVATKALVPIGGLAMIERPLRALLAHPRIDTVQVLTQAPELLLADPATCWMADEPRVRLTQGGAGIAASLLALMDGGAVALPFLVTTADHVLLDGAMIDAFLAQVEGGDIGVAMVERRTLLARYPQSRRTWLKFRGGWWSGANLFWIGSARARPIVALWQAVEQDRKKGWRVIAAFGPLLLTAAALRLVTLAGGIARAGRRFGADARVAAMPQPEACIDADKPDDVALIETILTDRRGG
jgi:GTP:adenosylcobinamide-phosphate guanylyltransferase